MSEAPEQLSPEDHHELQDRVLHDMGAAQPAVSKQWLREYFDNMLSAVRADPAKFGVKDDYLTAVVSKARQAAEKAERKFPQPNYVTLKVAEEAGEVVRAAVHYAEGRLGWEELEGEVVQTIAMLFRLLTEGDEVNGVTPPKPTLKT